MANSSSVNRLDDPKGSSQLNSAGACAYLFPIRTLCAGRSKILELCLSELLNILIRPKNRVYGHVRGARGNCPISIAGSTPDFSPQCRPEEPIRASADKR